MSFGKFGAFLLLAGLLGLFALLPGCEGVLYVGVPI